MFDNLGVVEEDVEETYLVAFLVCWLCKFVFLGKGVNLIHSGVFKVTSRMTQGETFSLASIFPIHCLYGWLDEYFDTHFLSLS